MPMAQTLILRIAPPEKVEMAMGLWMMTSILAPIAGPILGGVLADGIGWRWAFFINIPVCIVCGLWAWRLFRTRETQTARAPVDFIGMWLLALWVGALQIMLDNGEDRDWFASNVIIALFALSVIGFILFLIWEMTDRHPVVDLRVFRHRTFAVCAAAMSLTFGAFFAAIILLPLWLQINLGYTATLSGYILAFQGVLGIVVAPIAAGLMSRIDPRLMMSTGLAILAAAVFWRTGYALNIGFEQMILPQLAMGLGIPLFFVPLMTLSMAAVKPQEAASASGLINFLRTIAAAIATALVVSAWNTDTRATRVDIVGSLNRPQDILAHMQAGGLAPDKALRALDMTVQQQAIMVATNHMSLILSVIIAIAAVGVWLMPRPGGPVKGLSGALTPALAGNFTRHVMARASRAMTSIPARQRCFIRAIRPWAIATTRCAFSSQVRDFSVMVCRAAAPSRSRKAESPHSFSSASSIAPSRFSSNSSAFRPSARISRRLARPGRRWRGQAADIRTA